MKHNISLLLLTLAVVSCGGSSGGSKSNSLVPQEQKEITPVTESGSYFAILRPVNNSLSGYLPTGQAQIKIENDSFTVKTVLEDDAPVTHLQSVYIGDACPTAEDDVNGDGVIDVMEMEKATGQAIIPLDSDLTNQLNGTYLRGRSMTYAKSVSVKALMKSIMGEDTNPSDEITKIGDAMNFSVEGKVIVIHGISTLRTLPASVATLIGQTPQASTPVACGVIKKI